MLLAAPSCIFVSEQVDTRLRDCQMMRRSSLMLSSWRDQGISYVKYLNICTDALHSTVKESKAAKYTKFSNPGYHAQESDGTGAFVKREKIPDHVSKY